MIFITQSIIDNAIMDKVEEHLIFNELDAMEEEEEEANKERLLLFLY